MAAPRRIVVLTGAGISAESGIQTFRASDGLWEDHRIEDVATPEGFAANPIAVHQFYNDRRRLLLGDSVRPNPAHSALARLEHSIIDLPDHEFLLITQNIDNLHERAGSRALVHMHGELLKMRCEQSGLRFDLREDLSLDTYCRCCREPGNLRPDVVWFGEIPLAMPKITKALESCDLFIAVGTSGSVYPAAGFFELARKRGAHTIEMNLEATNLDFDERICGTASVTVPEIVNRILGPDF